MATQAYGKVYLVGAGPGDPGLLTVRGLECLRQADVVVYDALANDVLLRHAPGAEKIFVGKKQGQHALPQEDINRILLEQAAKAAHVVRLKGGDPFVFGRGGEEAQVLARHGVPFEVVPGVTAAIAAPAYAGIPVTHRGIAASFTLITGHADANRPSGLNLDQLAVEGTLAFYMGVKNLPAIVEELIRIGRATDTPVAVIEWGTYMRQRTITAPLNQIVARCRQAAIQPPAMILVGDVVALRDEIDWFERRPLFGKRIVVTRAAAGRGSLALRLREMGADVIELPTLEFQPPAEAPELSEAMSADWIVFTSPNAVAAVFEGLEQHGKDARALAGVRLLSLGSTTTQSLRERQIIPDLAPEGYEPERVVKALQDAHGSLESKRVLVPRSDLANSQLANHLRDAGAEVVEVAAYTAGIPPNALEKAVELLSPPPDLICFTSSAAVQNFTQIADQETLAALRSTVPAAVLGPVSAATAQSAGFKVAVMPAVHTVEALIEAIGAWAATRR
jgi:uroporphyrinogen III methyltransferase/synthase